MAEKKGIMKKVTEYFEGDREPGEIAPVDDSHVKGTSAVRVLDDAGSDITPEQEPETQGEETYQVEIAGVVREVNRETYDAVMAERANIISSTALTLSRSSIALVSPLAIASRKRPRYPKCRVYSITGFIYSNTSDRS